MGSSILPAGTLLGDGKAVSSWSEGQSYKVGLFVWAGWVLEMSTPHTIVQAPTLLALIILTPVFPYQSKLCGCSQ